MPRRFGSGKAKLLFWLAKGYLWNMIGLSILFGSVIIIAIVENYHPIEVLGYGSAVYFLIAICLTFSAYRTGKKVSKYAY
jgi:hypothetical protein